MSRPPLIVPRNGAREPIRLAIFCRFCSFTQETGDAQELSAITQHHLHTSHPDLAIQFKELSLMAQVASDRVGRFLDNMFATLPPEKYREQFNLILEQTEKFRDENETALQRLVKEKGLESTVVPSKENPDVQKDRPASPESAGDVPPSR